MCGIIGLYIKNPHLEQRLGELSAAMLIEMSERGPDSAGIAIYRDPVGDTEAKLTVVGAEGTDWVALESELSAAFGSAGETSVTANGNHAVLRLPVCADVAQTWLAGERPDLRVTSAGSTIEIYKEKGLPGDFVRHFDLRSLRGSHAVGHTRMATESAVTTEHSHPFSTGLDLCLVHNGSLSNHNTLRRSLLKRGVSFQTDNDSEVAAGYLTWRLSEGDTLEQALQAALRDLDGFYTFAVGTREGFAVLRDPFGCKPAVLAETDDWVAMASEFRAISVLPGASEATIWEPVPEQIYSWTRH